jgi:hypothetical protein
MDIIACLLVGAFAGYVTTWAASRFYRFNPEAVLRAADAADIGVVLVVVNYNKNKTGLLSNLGKRFPEGNAQEMTLDTLRTAVRIAKGEIPVAQ